MARPHDQQSYDEMMGLLRTSLYEFGDIEILSNRTGLSKAALYNLRSGRTKWPRWNTIETLMGPLNLRFTLTKYKP